MFRTITLAAIASLTLATSCVRPTEPAPAPQPLAVAPPRPAPVVVQPLADWIDRPATPGDWRYTADARGSVATFGTLAAIDFTVRCDAAARRVVLSRPGVLDPGRTARLTLRASTGATSYPLANSAEAPGTVAATLAATDPFLDSIAYTRGRFLVASEGAADMVLPAYAEVSRVLEDCRR